MNPSSRTDAQQRADEIRVFQTELGRLERAGMAHCAPKLNPKIDPNKWLSDKGAPWKKLANEKPKGETIAYETLLNAWKNGKVR